MKPERENNFHNKHEPNIREFKQTATATGGTSPNKRFHEQYNGCARPL